MKVVLAIGDRTPLDQPYIANLYRWLDKSFDTTVVLPMGFRGRSGVLENAPKRYVPNSKVKMHGKFIGAKLKLKAWALAKQTNLGPMRKHVGCRPIGEVAASLKALGCEHIIAIDHSALLAAQLAGFRAHLVSLELFHNSIEPLLISADTPRSCMTQNWLRYLSLFPKGQVPPFVVPNFPPFAGRELPPTPDDTFVLTGSAVPGFGLYVIADYLLKYPSRGTVLGWSPPRVLQMLQERGLSDETISKIHFQRDFLPEADFIDRVAAHRYAFSVYDLRSAPTAFFSESLGIHPWSALNYITGFPGKVGMCMNAGVPVIASNYPGMDFVQHYGVGAVVSDYSADAIHEAKCKILAGGMDMRRRCIELAKEYSFDKCIQPFLQFVADGSR